MKKAIMIIVIVGVLLAIGMLSGCASEVGSRADAKYSIYITDAPFGKYWVHDYGASRGVFILFFGAISGESNSDLKETYTIKFMNGDELKTLLISSTDPRFHVHLTDDNTTMSLAVECTAFKSIGNEDPYSGSNYYYVNHDASAMLLDHINDPASKVYNYYATDDGLVYVFDLYIPKPEICQLSNETIG